MATALPPAAELTADRATAGPADGLTSLDQRPARRWITGVEVTLIVLGLARLAFGQRAEIVGDGIQRLASLTALLAEGRLDRSDYSIVGPFFASPLWLLGRLAADDPRAGARYFNLAVLTAALLALWLLTRGLLPAALIRRMMLVLVGASMLAPEAGHFGGETFTTFAVTLGILLLLRGGPGNRSAGWAAVVLGVVNTPATLIGMIGVCVAEAWRLRRLRPLCPAVLAGSLILLEISVRQGGYPDNHGWVDVMPYSGRPGFSYPIFFGVLGVLLSFGRGLVYYIPGLFLPVRSAIDDLPRRPGIDLLRLHRLWALFVAGLVVVYAPWWAWYGGMSWGPRMFLVAIVPAALALALRLGHSRAGLVANLCTLGVLLLSGWVALAGLLWRGLWPPACYGGGRTPPAVEALCWHTPEYSSLWYPLVTNQFAELTAGQWLSVGYGVAAVGWLGWPAARQTVTQLRERGRAALATGGSIRDWRW
jgi:hypothetical protein